jgi:hypothetical protein
MNNAAEKYQFKKIHYSLQIHYTINDAHFSFTISTMYGKATRTLKNEEREK